MQPSTPVTTSLPQFAIQFIGDPSEITWGLVTTNRGRKNRVVASGMAPNISCARAQAETALLRILDAERGPMRYEPTRSMAEALS